VLRVEYWLEFVYVQHFFQHKLEVVVSFVQNLDVRGVYLMRWILPLVHLNGRVLFGVVVFFYAVRQDSFGFSYVFVSACCTFDSVDNE